MTPYAELQVSTNFSFLEGASHPDELALTAASLGHAAIAVTDRNTLAGVVRAHVAAEKHGLRLVVGCRLDLTDSGSVLAYPTDRTAYARLSRLLTLGKRRAPKGECFLGRDDVLEHSRGMLFLLVPPERRDAASSMSCEPGRRGWAGGCTSRPATATGATTPGGWPGWPVWRRPSGCRWWRPTTCCATPPPAASWPTC